MIQQSHLSQKKDFPDEDMKTLTTVFTCLQTFFQKATRFAITHETVCLCGLLALSLILKLLGHYLDPAIGRDGSFYCLTAHVWHETGRYDWGFPPLLLFIMKSGLARGFPVQSTAVAVNILSGVLCTVIGYGIAKETTENKKIAILSAALFAVHPGINALSIEVGRDTLYLCLAGFSAWSILAGLKRKSCLYWSIGGILCAFSLLTRHETLEFLPIVFVMLLAGAAVRMISWKQACLYAVCFYVFLAAVFCTALWGMGTETIIRQYKKYFSWQILRTQQQFSDLRPKEMK